MICQTQYLTFFFLYGTISFVKPYAIELKHGKMADICKSKYTNEILNEVVFKNNPN
jgi:hypothetical protein